MNKQVIAQPKIQKFAMHCIQFVQIAPGHLFKYIMDNHILIVFICTGKSIKIQMINSDNTTAQKLRDFF